MTPFLESIWRYFSAFIEKRTGSLCQQGCAEEEEEEEEEERSLVEECAAKRLG